ncbi:putative NAD dependent epimerase/dehydratase [Pestalotiopsis sp. NC0098]|nr:putative NAD dependent epimerase/dehydratase [Pestalotiopsis sp. NC0098]
MSSYIQDKLASGAKLHFFVTGATGYIGSAFTEKAIAAGHTVHGLSRSEAGDKKLEAFGAVPVRGDISTHDILKAESAQADAVIHLAWVHDFSRDFDEVAAADMAATDAIMSVLSGTGKPLLTASGAGGYKPHADGSAAGEDTPRMSGIPIMDARGRAEANVLKRSEDVHGVVIRLAPYCYGHGGKGFLSTWMSEAQKHGECLYVEGAEDRVISTLHVDDAADLYLAAVQYAGGGQVYNAIASSETTIKQMFDAIGSVMQLPVRGVQQEEAVEKWGQFLAYFVTIEVKVSNEKARSQLHWTPRGPAFLDDILTGSYKAVAQKLRASNTDLAAELRFK